MTDLPEDMTWAEQNYQQVHELVDWLDQFMPVIRRALVRVFPRRPDIVEEACEEAYDAAIKAILRGELWGMDAGHRCRWLRTVARNAALAVLRSPRIRRTVHLEKLPELDVVCHQQLQHVEEIRLAIEHLPEDQRAVIELHYYVGMTMTEVANRLGRHPQTVGILRVRAEGNLRMLLSDYFPQG